MIKQRVNPVQCVMAYVAGLVGLNMSWPFASGDRSIMTTFTRTNGLRMINGNDGRPGRGARRMAGITLIGRVNMV